MNYCEPREQSSQSLLARLQRFVGEIDRAAVMGLQDEEPDCHRAVGFFQQGMVAGKKFLQRYGIPQRFAHLLPVDGDHVVVHPVFHRHLIVRSY